MDTKVGYDYFDILNTSLQPLNGAVLQALPEGYRSSARYQFWTDTLVQGLQQGTNILPDQIYIDGAWFSVFNLNTWMRTDFLYHYHCVAIMEELNNDPSQSAGGGNYG